MATVGEADIHHGPLAVMLWRRLDSPGHEFARLEKSAAGPRLSGTAAFLHSQEPCHLSYVIDCDPQWKTRAASVRGHIGLRSVEMEIVVRPNGDWLMSDSVVPNVAGCIDLDLNFSPSTNLLPIRRANLAVGASATVRAAWLRFPDLKLEPLDQIYTRTSDSNYRYQSDNGRFLVDLTVNEHGFVVAYPGFWQAETGS